MVCIRVGQNHTVDPENTDRIEILHGRIGAFLPGAAAAVHQIGPARRLQHHALALTHVQHRHPVIFVQRREPTKSNGNGQGQSAGPGVDHGPPSAPQKYRQ